MSGDKRRSESVESDRRRDSREGSEDRRDSRDRNDVNELATKTFRLQSKRFFVDVKENKGGRFIKLVEGLPNGKKNKINFPINVAKAVVEKLAVCEEHFANLDEAREEKRDDDDQNASICSEIIRAGNRTIYMDLKENRRGVFVRISMKNNNSARSNIALPAEGISDIRQCLDEFYHEYHDDEALDEPELPECKDCHIEHKRFYFDCGRNGRGSFLRVSEVTANYRSSITIPAVGDSLAEFRKIIDHFHEKLCVAEKEA